MVSKYFWYRFLMNPLNIREKECAVSNEHRVMLKYVRTSKYHELVSSWPTAGRHILAHYDDQSILVYQAYNNSIADAALKAGNFHSDEVLKAGYSTSRMTWIKTNFLWMMYRSGWASKPQQERILAIRITREGFDEILKKASTQGTGSVRLQWDPDHTPDGSKLPDRRAIQLGLRGEVLERFSREFIVSITDVTDFVKEQSRNVSDTCEYLVIPEESVYKCSDEAAENINVDKLQL